MDQSLFDKYENQKEEEMLKCSYCETPLIAGASVCYVCGTPVILNPDENVLFLVSEKEANPISANLTADISVDNTPSSVQENSVLTYDNSHVSPFLDASERIPVPSVIHPLSQVSKRTSKENLILLSIVVLVIITGVGSIYYGAVYQPALNAANIRAAQATATAQAIAQANKLRAMYIKTTSSKPFLVDSLNNPATSLWSEYQSPEYSDGSCFFKNKAFHVTVDTKSSMNWCNETFSIKNFALQVEMLTVKGDSCGIMFRYVLDQSDGQYNERGLYLEVDTDGTYGLFKFHRTSSDGPMNWTQLGADQSSIINTGYNKSNLVTIIAHDKQIYLYINKQFLAQFQDSTNANGEVDAGNFVLTAGEDTHPTETAFSNVQVWAVD